MRIILSLIVTTLFMSTLAMATVYNEPECDGFRILKSSNPDHVCEILSNGNEKVAESVMFETIGERGWANEWLGTLCKVKNHTIIFKRQVFHREKVFKRIVCK